MEQLEIESMGGLYGVDSVAISTGDKYIYPVNVRSAAVEVFQSVLEKELTDLHEHSQAPNTSNLSAYEKNLEHVKIKNIRY